MYGKTLLQIGFEHVLGLNMYGNCSSGNVLYSASSCDSFMCAINCDSFMGFSVCLLRMMGGNKKKRLLFNGGLENKWVCSIEANVTS